MINKTPLLLERAERTNGAFLSVIDSRVLLDYPLICLGSWYPIQCCSLWFKELYLRYDLSIGTLYGAEKRGDWMGGKWYWLAHKLFVLCCTALYYAVLYCTVLFVCRYDFYEKAVTFKPYQVDMLDPVTANFLGDNLRCWMQIQVSHSIQIFFVVNFKYFYLCKYFY